MSDFSAAPYLKEKTRTQLKLIKTNIRIRVSYQNAMKSGSMFDDDTDETDDDLDVKARDIFQTPNHDSENACQYAVVNKSREI